MIVMRHITPLTGYSCHGIHKACQACYKDPGVGPMYAHDTMVLGIVNLIDLAHPQDPGAHACKHASG